MSDTVKLIIENVLKTIVIILMTAIILPIVAAFVLGWVFICVKLYELI